MADEEQYEDYLEQEPEAQTPAAQAAQQDRNADPELEKLRRQNAQLLGEVKQARAQQRTQFLEQFPQLSEDDVKGLPLDRLRAITSKLAPSPQGTTEQAQEPTQEQRQMAQAAALAGGGLLPSGQPEQGAKQYTAADIREGMRTGAINGRVIAELEATGRIAKNEDGTWK